MQEKIITQLQESLEAIQLTSAKSLELALQVLAWVKLSSTGELSDDLSLSTTLLDEPSRLLQVLTRLAQEGDLIGQAFANGTDFGRLDPRLLQPALTLALRLDQAGMLKNFDPVRAISSLSSKFSQEPDLPLEVTALLAGLAGGLPGEGVYVPWDSRGTLAASVTSADTDVYLESPILSAVPALISLLSDHRFQVHYADPIRNPSAVENGQLRQFDVAVAFPPMGIRYSADVTNNDWFSRFPEKTTSGAVLAILHLLRQAKRRVVIAVSNSLYSVRALSARCVRISSGRAKLKKSFPCLQVYWQTPTLPFPFWCLTPPEDSTRSSLSTLTPLTSESRYPRLNAK